MYYGYPNYGYGYGNRYNGYGNYGHYGRYGRVKKPSSRKMREKHE